MTSAEDDLTLPGGPSAHDGEHTLPGGPGRADDAGRRVGGGSGPGAASDSGHGSGSFGATRAEGRARGAAGAGRFGDYRLLEELGRGGQGVVYLAEDVRLGRRVALKILSSNFAADHGSRLRFEREAAAAARLDHPGICTVYEAGVVDGAPFIAMRYVAGETLAARIKRRREATDPASGASGASGVSGASGGATTGGARRREVFQEAEIVEKAARALHAAHEAGLVHRDVKPANLMIEASGEPVVLDFGLARDAGLVEDGGGLTATGGFVGTPAYMAPEQAAGGRVVDRRADVWALGVSLYETVARRRPFEAPTIEGLLRAVRSQDPVDPRKQEPACTPELAAVIACAMEKDPSRRYADARAFADDVGRARRLEPVQARAAGPLVRARRFVERNPIPVAAAFAVVLALSIALGASLRFLNESRAALARETAAKSRESAARGRAEDLLDFLLGDLKFRLDEAGRLELLGSVARKAADYFADLPPDPADSVASKQRAAAFRNVGDVLKAEGDTATAELRYRDALQVLDRREAVGGRDAAGDYERTVTLAASATLAMSRGDHAEAERRSVEACAIRTRLKDAAPDDVDLQVLFASGLVLRANTRRNAGAVQESLAFYEEAVEAWRKLGGPDAPPRRRRELGVALQNQGEAFRSAGKSDAALASRREGLAVFESLLAAEPESFDFAEQVATTRHGLALLLHGTRRADEALAEIALVVRAFRNLVARDPLNARRKYQLGTALHATAVMSEDAGRRSEAALADAESSSVRRALAATDPRNKQWRLDALLSWRRHAARLGEAGQAARSATEYAEATEFARALRREFPSLEADVGFSRTSYDLATSSRETGDLATAAKAAAEAAVVSGECAASRPVPVGLEEAARGAQWAAVAAFERGDAAAALRFAQDSVLLSSALAAKLEGVKAFVWRAFAELRRVDAARYAHQALPPAEAASIYAAAVAGVDAVAAEKSGVRDLERARIDVRLDRAAAARRAGRYAEALASAAEAAELADDTSTPTATADADPPRDPAKIEAEIRRLTELAGGATPLGSSDLELAGELLLREGRSAEARAALEKALHSLPRRAVKKLGPQETDLRLAFASAAAAEASTAPASIREAKCAAAVRELLPVVAAWQAELAAREERSAEEAKVGVVSDPTREAAATLRRRLGALRESLPEFAALRGRADFAAMFAP